jgi:hypothetical protein
MLKTAGTQSITAMDAADGVTGTEGTILVQAAALSKLVVVGFPTPVTAGASGSFSVIPQDAYGNAVSAYTGTIRFSSSDPRAVLPADYTFNGNIGQAFNGILKTAGTQWLAATDLTLGLTGTDVGIRVNAAVASSLRITGPASVGAGALFSVTVTAVDAFGNDATGYTGSVSFKSSDGSATLPARYAFTAADQGIHIFASLKLKKKGTQTVTITDTLNPGLTATISVNVL